MTVPDDEPRRPGVYARLAEEAATHRAVLSPPRWIRWAGAGICLAIAAGVVVAALEVHPW
ncbi:MAG: hypothetical protein AB7V62_05875 [Thermoleophilia bacterium]